jgi:hypothetical protein
LIVPARPRRNSGEPTAQSLLMEAVSGRSPIPEKSFRTSVTRATRPTADRSRSHQG